MSDFKKYILLFLYTFLSLSLIASDKFEDNFYVFTKVGNVLVPNSGFFKNIGSNKKGNEQTDNYLQKIKSSKYLEAIKLYESKDSIVEDVVCYRGDSRFPWKVWEQGGFWPKKKSDKYNVSLHQSSPTSGQSVVSTFSKEGSGNLYATSFGLVEEMFVSKIHSFEKDTDKTWKLNKGYVYVVKVEKGISLEKVNQNIDPYSYQKMIQKRYKWENEVAVLEGIPRSAIVAARGMEKDPDSSTYKNRYTNEIFIRKFLFEKKNVNELKQIMLSLGQIEKSYLNESLKIIKRIIPTDSKD
jgi:hypothetical protein